jgi:hypothetical protein
MGDRISVLIPLNQNSGEYAIRDSSITSTKTQFIQCFSILRYPGVKEVRDKHKVMQIPDSKPHIDLVDNIISKGGKKMDEMKDLAPFPPLLALQNPVARSSS